MKKIVTLALALIMALSLAAPAMAFTGLEATATDSEIGLAIRLVDVSAGYVNVNFDAPASNRGYVKNEVVCAVVSLSVPKNVDPAEKYGEMVFSGKNVSLYQDENFTAALDTSATSTLTHISKNADTAFTTDRFFYRSASEIVLDNDGLAELADTVDQTYHFAVFGKVLADDATMTATLNGAYKLTNDITLATATAGAGATEWKDSSTPYASTDVASNIRLNDVGDYYISYVNTTEDATSSGSLAAAVTDLIKADEVGYFVIDKNQFNVATYSTNSGSVTVNAYKFLVVTDKNFACKRMYVFNPAKSGAQTGGEAALAFQVAESAGGQSISGISKAVRFYAAASGNLETTLALSLADVLKSTAVNDFKLDPTVSGVLKPDWWKGYEEKTVSVDIEPWYAEVTVPPEIEIEIPKTGDALSVMGFVLVALAGLAVVAVRKVRA